MPLGFDALRGEETQRSRDGRAAMVKAEEVDARMQGKRRTIAVALAATLLVVATGLATAAQSPSAAPLPTPVTVAPSAPATQLAYQGDITFWNTMRDFEF